MTRDEAKKMVHDDAMFRPLSLSTMSLCDRTDNKTLKRILSPDDGSIVVDMYSLLEFLYIHYKQHSLADISQQIKDGEIEAKALEWGETVDPVVVDEGVAYFTDTKKR